MGEAAARQQCRHVIVGRVKLSRTRQQIVSTRGIPIGARTIQQSSDVERLDRAIDVRAQLVTRSTAWFRERVLAARAEIAAEDGMSV